MQYLIHDINKLPLQDKLHLIEQVLRLIPQHNAEVEFHIHLQTYLDLLKQNH